MSLVEVLRHKFSGVYKLNEIKFGTDGWRGVIADNFTFANVAKVSQAIADYYKIYRNKKMALAIGYDTRFLSNEFARVVAEVLMGNEFHIILSSGDLPTQAISFTIGNAHLDGGIMITASHNPPQFNGIKIRSSSGASVLPEVTSKIESFLGKNEIKRVSLEKADKKKLIIKKDLIPDYIKKVESFLDIDLLKEAHLKVIYDPMFGAGDGVTQKIFAQSNCEVITINHKYNPGFGGLNPEPIEKNLEDLKKRVVKEKADLGIATDGDADRVGIVDNKGRYLTPHQVFSLLLLYLVRERKMRGGVVKTVSLGYQPERIAKKFNLPLIETPVGFKYICNKMVKGNVLLGGEESGGYGYRGHLLERDGILSSLLFVEMITKAAKSLFTLLENMEKEFGASFFGRIDFKQAGVNKKKMVEKISSLPLSSLGGIPISKVKTIDGIKFVMKDESWLLIRPSGTEPKVRVYAEASNEDRLRRIIEEGVKMAKDAI